MAFGVTMIFLIVAYYSYKWIFQPLSEWLKFQALLPEHRRDKDKPLHVGQIWTDDRRYFTIRSLSPSHVGYSLYVGRWSDGSKRDFSHEYYEMIEDFQEVMSKGRLHLTDRVIYWWESEALR